MRKNSLYIAMEMNLLSLNSDGALRTIMHKRTPHARNSTSTKVLREKYVKAEKSGKTER